MKLYPIPNWPGYLITKGGRVWSKRSGRWLKIHIDRSTGYVTVTLSQKNSQPRIVNVHRLVLETFIGPCPEGMECRHLDGNKQNSDLSNLKWGTHYENILDGVAQGNYRGNRKLNEWQVRVINHLLTYPEFTHREIGEIFGVNQPAISDINRGRTWSSVTGRSKTL